MGQVFYADGTRALYCLELRLDIGHRFLNNSIKTAQPLNPTFDELEVETKTTL